jgi:hypothetical protein
LLLNKMKEIMLESIITSKTRLRLLIKFFINAANEGYLRGLATEMQESTNAIRKELNNLSEAGYLLKNEEGFRVTYTANKQHPLFGLMQKIVRKYIGLDALVEQIVSRVGEVKRVFLVGDYAKGIDSGTIEVVLEGEAINLEYLAKLAQKAEQEINKKVSVSVTEHFEGDGLLVFEQE